MDLLQLRYFKKVAQLKHLTQAAQELYITQPALSQTIARLEKDVGVSLFDRQGRQIRLNEYGKVFLKKVDIALNALDEGRREIADMSGLMRGIVSIDTTFLPHFSDVINDFRSSYQEVHFRISQVSTKEMQKHLLESGEIDFCITCMPIERKGFRNLPIQTEEILLVVPPKHRFAKQSNIKLSEVAGEPFIHFKKGHSFRTTTDELCQKAGFTPNIVCETDDTKTMKDLVNTGLGLAFTIKSLLDKEKLVHYLHIKEPICKRTYYLVWSDSRYLSLAARTFRESLIQYSANEGANDKETNYDLES